MVCAHVTGLHCLLVGGIDYWQDASETEAVMTRIGGGRSVTGAQKCNGAWLEV